MIGHGIVTCWIESVGTHALKSELCYAKVTFYNSEIILCWCMSVYSSIQASVCMTQVVYDETMEVVSRIRMKMDISKRI